MAEQKAGGYTLDVADDIAGNPAVVMQDECHCDNPQFHQTGMTYPVAQKLVDIHLMGRDDIAGNPQSCRSKSRWIYT